MSIEAKPWPSGGSVVDASETTKGIIRIATSAEAATGTDDLTAMTPLTVKERIDAALVGGVQYQGTFDATAGTPSIANAEKGDLYIIDTAGTIYGQTWAIGDHLLINADMGGVIDNAKIDKIDNTDAVTSLNDLSDVTLSSVVGGDLLQNNGSGQFVNVVKSTINLSSFNDDLTYIGAVVEDSTPQLGGPLDVNGQAITSASNGNVTINPNGTGDIIIGADLIPDADATHTIGDENNRFISAYTDINGAIRFKAKNDSGGVINKGQAVYIKGVSGTVPTVGLAQANSSSTMPAFGLAFANSNDQADVEVITFGNLTDYNTTTYSLSANNTVYVSASTAGGLTNSAPTGEANLIQNIGRVVRADASAGIIKVGGAGRTNATPNLNDGNVFLGNASNQAVSTAISTINLSSFNDDLGSTYQPLDAGLTSISGLTTAADKMIYTTASDTYAVADLTSAGRALLDDSDASAQRTTLGLGTAATSASTDFLASTAVINDLSDVTISSVSNGQVLSYNSTSGDWENTTPASGGATDLDGLSDVTLTSVTGGDLLQNNGSGQFVNVAKSTIALSSFNNDLGLATVATTGAYSDLSGTPTLATVATTGAYSDLSGTPTIPADLDDLSDVTITTATGGDLLQNNGSGQFVNVAKSTINLSSFNDDLSYQPLDAGLTSISGLTTSADKMIYTTASDTYAVTDLTSAGRALLDDADASAQRTTLGLGTAATSASTDFLASTATIGNLSDVTISSVSNGQVLSYNSTSGDWENTTPTSGGTSYTYQAVTSASSPVTAQAWYHYSVDASGGAVTINLPALSSMTDGDEIRIKIRNASNDTTIDGNSTETIDGAQTQVLGVAYVALTLVAGSSEWEII